MDNKTLFEALAKVDEKHFAVVEDDYVCIYNKDEFAPTPVFADK